MYKHHFKLISSQLLTLSKLTDEVRINTIEQMISEAIQFYNEIKRAGVLFFDDNCDSGHLQIWNRALRRFKVKGSE